MSPSYNVIYLARSTSPPTTPSSHQPLMPAPEPWPYHGQSPMLEIGSKWFHLQLHLHDREFRLCLCYWLGLRLQSRESGCPFCTRGLVADSFGDHQVGCGGNGDRIHRHDALRDVLYAAAQSAALAPRKETPSLIPGSYSRPADVFLPIWCRGRPAALDVSVISTLQPCTSLSGAANSQGHALKVAEDRKMTVHNDACSSVGVTFIAFVVESLGGWSEEAIGSISRIGRIGRLMGQRSGSPTAEAARHLFQRLAIKLWRGNASLWLCRLPTHSAQIVGVTCFCCLKKKKLLFYFFII